jgi:hypothetical protein
MVTGSHHMQAFWVPSEVGNGQLSLPFTYLFDDQRWVPRGDVFLHPPDARHQEQVWNVSCITCHTTGGQPGALVGGKEIASRVGEMGITSPQTRIHFGATCYTRAVAPIRRSSTRRASIPRAAPTCAAAATR